MKKYDLTTISGYELVMKEFGRSFDTYGWIVSPAVWLAYKASKLFSKSVDINRQADALEKMIKAGRENNVDEMEVKIDNAVSGKLKVDVPGVKIDVRGNVDGKSMVKVKYK